MVDNDKPARESKTEKSVEDSEKAADVGNTEVQERTDEANEQGYLGWSPDPTPRDNYTVRGVVEGKPTPETDADAAAEAVENIYQGGRGRRV